MYMSQEFPDAAAISYIAWRINDDAFWFQIGDPKDNVRKSVHNLFKKLTDIYPALKIFTYLLEGLASKNSKTRMGKKRITIYNFS